MRRDASSLLAIYPHIARYGLVNLKVFTDMYYIDIVIYKDTVHDHPWLWNVNTESVLSS